MSATINLASVPCCKYVARDSDVVILLICLLIIFNSRYPRYLNTLRGSTTSNLTKPFLLEQLHDHLYAVSDYMCLHHHLRYQRPVVVTDTHQHVPLGFFDVNFQQVDRPWFFLVQYCTKCPQRALDLNGNHAVVCYTACCFLAELPFRKVFQTLCDGVLFSFEYRKKRIPVSSSDRNQIWPNFQASEEKVVSSRKQKPYT